LSDRHIICTLILSGRHTAFFYSDRAKCNTVFISQTRKIPGYCFCTAATATFHNHFSVTLLIIYIVIYTDGVVKWPTKR